MSEKQQVHSHVHAFDGIRALAALAVFLYHLVPAFVPHGYLGVQIFFVLAGFLTMRSVLLNASPSIYRVRRVSKDVQMGRTDRAAGLSWLRGRVTRLWPPMLLMLTAVTILMLTLSQFRAFLPRYGTALISGLLGISNTVQAITRESYFEGQGYLKPLTHLWALSLEWQFYFIFALTVRRFYGADRRRNWAQVYAIGVLLSAAFFFLLLGHSAVNPAYYSLAARLHAFLLGGLGAFWVTREPGRPFKQVTKTLRNGSSLLLTLVLLAGFVVPYPLELGILVGLPLYGLLVTLLLMLLHSNEGILAAVSRRQPIAWLANRSYELYLWHYPVFGMLSFALAGYKLDHRLIFLLQIAVSLLLTEASWQLLQRFSSWAQAGSHSRRRSPALLSLLLSVVLLESGVVMIAATRGPTEMDQLREAIEEQEERLAQEASSRAAEASSRAAEATQTTAEGTTSEASETESALTSAPETSTADTSKETSTAESTAPVTVESETTLSPEEEIAALLADVPQTAAYGYMQEWFHLGGAYLIRQTDYMAIRDRQVTVIGDSLAVSLSYAIETFLPAAEVYAESNRQLHEAPAILAELDQLGLLGDTVLLVLGSNGEIDPADLDAVRQVTGERQLILATIVLPYADSEARRNQVIRDYVAEYPEIGLVDWFAHGKGQDGIFLSDQIHLTIPGNRAYIQLICVELVRLRNQ